MWSPTKIREAFRTLFKNRQVENRLSEELRFHLDMQIEDNLRSGMNRQEARRRALVELGGVEQVRQRVHEVRSGSFLATAIQDLAYGARMLRRSPAFTAVAVVTLALGIGANTAIFTVVNTVLLRPLPYPEAERLASIGNSWTGYAHSSLSIPEYLDHRERSESFEEVAAHGFLNLNVTGGQEEPQRVRGAGVTAGFFSVLGVEAELGRVFHAEENNPAESKVAVLSHRLWRDRFGKDPAIVGRIIRLHGEQYSVVGTMPAGFHYPSPSTDIWTPLPIDRAHLPNRGSRNRLVIARLKKGVSLLQARAEMETIAERLREEHPDHYKAGYGWGVSLRGLQEHRVGDMRTPLMVLLAAVGLVLLIACVNVANLLLARGAVRVPELAVRAALGAGRWRLLRQMLTESTLLALMGGALGLLLAFFGVEALTNFELRGIPRLDEVGIDGRILVFTLALATLTGLAAGVIPAWQVSRRDIHHTLSTGGRTLMGAVSHRLRHFLVIGEVALALVLLVGSSLMVRSFLRLVQTDPGLRAAGVVTTRLSLTPAKYPESHQVVEYYRQLSERLRAQPGVESVGLGTWLPLSGSNEDWSFGIEGYQPPSPSLEPDEQARIVSGGYFPTLGIPLIRGRFFSPADTADSPSAVIISRSLAEKYWAGQDPIGKRLKLWSLQSQGPWRTVVGIVGDVRHGGLDSDLEPIIYFPYTQQTRRGMSVVVKSGADSDAVKALIRREVQALDGEQPVFAVRTMDEYLSRSLSRNRFNLFLLSLFGGLALLLAVIGVGGVLAFYVSERNPEIGLRMTLGARRTDILRWILTRALIMTSLGVGVGLAIALACTRFLESLLFEVGATDPLSFLSVAALLMATAFLASLLPARRAMRVNPMDSL